MSSSDASDGASGSDAATGDAPRADGSGPVDGPALTGASPTVGWREVPFTYSIHKPYDLQESDRHSYDPATNTHTFWILNGDKPHEPPPNTTGARCELRMKNDYTSGDHQFEADAYVVAGTAGPTIMQVFGGSAHATASMHKVHAGGVLKHYDREILKTDIYDKWFHLNVIHHASAGGVGQVMVYINNQLVGTFNDNGPATHYFKCGVYNISSPRAESRFRNIKYWVR